MQRLRAGEPAGLVARSLEVSCQELYPWSRDVGEDEEVKEFTYAVALGRLGGRKGGKIRFSRLAPEQRSELGRKAVSARWAKERKSKSAANVIRPDKIGSLTVSEEKANIVGDGKARAIANS